MGKPYSILAIKKEKKTSVYRWYGKLNRDLQDEGCYNLNIVRAKLTFAINKTAKLYSNWVEEIQEFVEKPTFFHFNAIYLQNGKFASLFLYEVIVLKSLREYSVRSIHFPIFTTYLHFSTFRPSNRLIRLWRRGRRQKGRFSIPRRRSVCF